MFEWADAEYRAAGQSYLACTGPYEVNEVAGIVRDEIGVSLFPIWAGARQSRVVTLIGDELTLCFEAPQQSRGALWSVDFICRRAVKR
ncbi:MAG: lipocalin-like domain-containing protein [Rhodobacteraceae bacterium]|nr:lipocalin-like domain-containing protein [Paracoccaceae bacterium]